MSRGKGAPSGAPSTPAEAERQLDAATTPAQAWAIYEIASDREEGWRVVKLKAERRYGELLPPPKPGKRTSNTPLEVGGDAMAASRARKVAAVPEAKFNDYVETNGAASTRAGLLREHGPKPATKSAGRQKAGMNPAVTNPAVIDWVAAGRAEGMNREQLIEASRERSDFPGPKPLSGGVVSAIDGILYDRKVRDAPKQPAKRKATAGGKRKRKIYEEIRTDGDTELRRLRIDIADATMKLEHMMLPEDVSLSEEAQDDIATLYHDLGTLLEWTEMAITATVAQMGDMTKQRTIKKLRDRAQDPSSTPDERISATRLADKLQQKHRAQRLGQ